MKQAQVGIIGGTGLGEVLLKEEGGEAVRVETPFGPRAATDFMRLMIVRSSRWTGMAAGPFSGESRDEKGWVGHVFKRGEAQKENDVPQV